MTSRWSNLEAIQVGHCLDMIVETPQLIADERLPTGAHVACIESFFSNMRALVEFLVLDAAAGRIHRTDYHSTWSPETSARSSELRRVYGLASEQVSHLMKKRVKSATEPHVRVDAEGLRAIADLAFAEFDEFVVALRNEDSDAALLFEGFLVGARQRNENGIAAKRISADLAGVSGRTQFIGARRGDESSSARVASRGTRR